MCRPTQSAVLAGIFAIVNVSALSTICFSQDLKGNKSKSTKNQPEPPKYMSMGEKAMLDMRKELAKRGIHVDEKAPYAELERLLHPDEQPSSPLTGATTSGSSGAMPSVIPKEQRGRTLEDIVKLGLEGHKDEAVTELSAYQKRQNGIISGASSGESFLCETNMREQKLICDAFLTFSDDPRIHPMSIYRYLGEIKRRGTRSLFTARLGMQNSGLADGYQPAIALESRRRMLNKQLWDSDDQSNIVGILDELDSIRQESSEFEMIEQITHVPDDVKHAYTCDPEQILRRLPPRTAFVDIQYYSTPVLLDAKNSKSKKQPGKYRAFIFSVSETNGTKQQQTGNTLTPLSRFDGKGQVQMIDLGDADLIERDVAAWIRDIKTKRPSQVSGAKVTARLWNPLAKAMIAEPTTLYLCVDGVLNNTPWGALPISNGKEILLEKMSVATVPFPGFLIQGFSLDQQSVRYATFNPPEFDLLAILGDSQLKSAPVEIDNILSTATKLNTHFIPEKDASPQNVLEFMPKAKIVHIVSHGLFASSALKRARDANRLPAGPLENAGDAMMFSAIVLNHSHPSLPLSERTLSGDQISRVSCPSLQLVVLSACSTAIGAPVPGEGTIGLVTGLHLAGAQNVVGSLWDVDDDATGLLMSEFYRHMFSFREPPIEAMRQAQLSMYRSSIAELGKHVRDEEDKAKVRNWAGFVLSGTGTSRIVRTHSVP